MFGKWFLPPEVSFPGITYGSIDSQVLNSLVDFSSDFIGPTSIVFILGSKPFTSTEYFTNLIIMLISNGYSINYILKYLLKHLRRRYLFHLRVEISARVIPRYSRNKKLVFSFSPKRSSYELAINTERSSLITWDGKVGLRITFNPSAY